VENGNTAICAPHVTNWHGNSTSTFISGQDSAIFTSVPDVVLPAFIAPSFIYLHDLAKLNPIFLSPLQLTAPATCIVECILFHRRIEDNPPNVPKHRHATKASPAWIPSLPTEEALQFLLAKAASPSQVQRAKRKENTVVARRERTVVNLSRHHQWRPICSFFGV